jgi:hypothetical protein
MLPGHSVIWVDNGPSASPGITDTRQGFVVAEAERGSLLPQRVTSLAGAIAKYGSRQSYSYLYDGLETAFAEGCPAVWVARVASSTAVTATLNLADIVPATTLVIKAIGPGTYGNSQSVQILTSVDDPAIPVGSFKIRMIEGGVTIEDSPVFATKADALAWAPTLGDGNAQTFALTDAAGTGVPVRLAATPLATGADNRGGIVDADWQTALDRFTINYGPGQVAMFGQTTSTRQLMLIAHARLRNRHALIDTADTAVIATLTGAMATINAAPTNGSRFCSAYWPWAKIPPLSGTFGYRVVPMSAAMMGLYAAAEEQGGDAGVAAAGEQNGVFRFVQAVSQDVTALTEANATLLDDAGLNITRIFFGISAPVQYGNRTPRNRSIDPIWAEASGSRLAMAIAAQGDAVMRQWVHRRVSGQVSLGQLQSQLAQVLEPLRERGALFGATPQEAYDVDAMSDAVNSPAQLETGLLRAILEYKTSPSPSTVRLELARTSITANV